MNVNDRVTVKTDGGPRRPCVVLAVEPLMKVRCIWFHWRSIRWEYGSLMRKITRTGYLSKRWNNTSYFLLIVTPLR